MGNLPKTSAIEQIMGSILYECASQEKLDMLPFYIQFFQKFWEIGKPAQPHLGHQMRILVKLTAQDHMDCCGEQGLVCRLVNPEIVTSLYQGLKYKFDFYAYERRKNIIQGKEKNDRERQIPKMEPCNLNTFANLLVLHQMSFEDYAEDKISTEFKEPLIKFDKAVNPLEVLLKNKRHQNNL